MTGSFVQRSGTQLTLDGLPFHFTGFNMPYLMHPSPTGGLAYLETALAAIPTTANVFRLFCFQTYNIVSGAIDWTLLDSLLAAFAAAGKRVILVLGNNNPGSAANDDGAAKDLVWWQGGSPSGYDTVIQSTSSPAQVVTYRDWVSQIVTRYKDNPTILMWQLLNESQALRTDHTDVEVASYDAMLAFVNDVAAMVKGIDSNHLVSLGNILGYNGIFSLQWCGSRTWYNAQHTPVNVGEQDYRLLLTSPYLDTGDYHNYDFPANPLGQTDGDAEGGRILAIPGLCNIGATVGKPVMIAENGIDWTGLTPNTLDQRAALFQVQAAAQFLAGVSGILMWTWRNNPQSSDGSDYGMEVGPSDPVLAVMDPALYVPKARLLTVSSVHRRHA